MRPAPILLLSLFIMSILLLLTISACTPSRPEVIPTGKAPLQKSTHQDTTPPDTTTPSTEPLTTPPGIEKPGMVTPTQSLPPPGPSEDSFHGVKLIPKRPVSDDDLVLAMTILKLELGARPELKVKDISRTGSRSEAQILVETSLSSTKPLVSVINALLNRDRFEGRIGETVLFNNNDIRFICTIPACAGVEDVSVCPRVSDSYTCTWAFGMVLWEQAARRIGESTTGLPTKSEGNETIIAEPINLYLNKQLIDYVYVPADTAGTPITDMTITGNASGATAADAQQRAVSDMDRLRKKMSFKVMPVEMEVIG